MLAPTDPAILIPLFVNSRLREKVAQTGVVPAALVGVIVGLGLPHGEIYASVVALAIVVTLVFQALPAAWLARRLGLLDGVRTTAGSDPLPTE